MEWPRCEPSSVCTCITFISGTLIWRFLEWGEVVWDSVEKFTPLLLVNPLSISESRCEGSAVVRELRETFSKVGLALSLFEISTVKFLSSVFSLLYALGTRIMLPLGV